MKNVALFAGIGGLELGLHKAGHETVVLSELWAPASAVLTARFPDVPNHGDIGHLKGLPSGTDLISAGFPCQDLSQAGLTQGISGSKSGLVGHVFRLIDKKPVPWVLLENVSFMLHLDGGRAMDTLVSAFEERGYRWAYRVINSLGFLPQRRERVFFLASRTEAPEEILFVDEVKPPQLTTRLDTHAHGFYWTEGIRGLGWAADAVPTLKNGSTIGIASPPAVLLPNGRIIKPDIRDAERLQGFPIDWTQPAENVGKPSWRWSLVGNAVTVPVAEWVGRRLKNPKAYDRSRDCEAISAKKWPRAARWDGNDRRRVEISDLPVWKKRPSLEEFLRFPGEPLSVRATSGFLNRIERSSLRFVPGFKERVREHLQEMQSATSNSRLIKKRALWAAE